MIWRRTRGRRACGRPLLASARRHSIESVVEVLVSEEPDICSTANAKVVTGLDFH